MNKSSNNFIPPSSSSITFKLFSTLSSKQFTDSKDSELHSKITKEQVITLYDRVKKQLSHQSSFTTSALILGIEKKITDHQKEFPDSVLPKEIQDLITFCCIGNNSLFIQILQFIENDQYGLIENVDELKRHGIFIFLRYSYFSSVLIKAIQREWFNFEELKISFPTIKTGIEIDGKDIVTYDQVTYLSMLNENILRSFINTGSLTSRETLMALISFISLLLFRNSNELLPFMRRFVEMYPIVKQLYITPYEGDGNKSWTDVLEKVYTEDEFDWYQDLETELPIHLGGMYNIFKEYIRQSNDGSLLKVLEEEGKKAPNNPYIPYYKIMMADGDVTCTDECLAILSKSKAHSRVDDLKRIELFGIFNNKKPTIPRIMDFKYFPQLFFKAKYLALIRDNDRYNSAKLLEQVEYYSRVPSFVDLIAAKFMSNLKARRLEEALQNYSCFSYFEQILSPDLIYIYTNYAVKPMVHLGYHDDTIELIGKLKNKYEGDARWSELLEAAREEIERVTKKKLS